MCCSVVSQKTSPANQLKDLGDLLLQIAMWVSNYDIPLQLIMTVSFCDFQCLRINLLDSHVLVGFDATLTSTSRFHDVINREAATHVWT